MTSYIGQKPLMDSHKNYFLSRAAERDAAKPENPIGARFAT